MLFKESMIAFENSKNYLSLKKSTVGQAAHKCLSNLKVLLVEDNVDNQFLIFTILNRHSAEVTVANNGAEACFLAGENNYDVVIMDIQMPVMDGFNATKIIKANKPETPVIALTANSNAADEIHSLTKGFDHFLTKPIDFKMLVNALQSYVPKPGWTDLTP